MREEQMIYPQFIGRLGNNLFQIAACIGYAKKHNVKWGIKKKYVERGFGVFQVDKYFPHLPACDHDFRRYNEPSFSYNEIPFHPKGVQIVGFWQSLKYFENAQDEVKSWLKLKTVEGYRDYVAVHIRRGDYATNPDHFPPVDMHYLLLASLEIERGLYDAKYIIFSDDIKWCRSEIESNFSQAFNDKVMYSEGRNEYEDLCLMASCGHNIIANSSFSWWGAYLNENPDKIVVSPSKENWFGPKNGVKDQTQDLIPDNWIQIKFR